MHTFSFNFYIVYFVEDKRAPLLYRSRSRNAFTERDLPTTRVQL